MSILPHKFYAVTVMDNWTPMREFWSWNRALAFYIEHSPASYFHVWHRAYGWVELKFEIRVYPK